MKSSIRSLSLLSLGSMAILAAACGSAGDIDEPAVSEEKAEAMAEEFEYAPDDAAVAPSASPDQEKDGGALVGKGAFSYPLGTTWNEAVTIQNGETVTFESVGGQANGIDPILVLYMRHTPWNSTKWVSAPWTEKVGLRTLAQNDDFGSYPDRDARVTYTNNTGGVVNAWIMGFAWQSSVGALSVTKTSSISGTVNLGAKNFTSGGTRVYSTAGEAYTSGSRNVEYPQRSVDPVLFAFDTTNGLDNGAWNDDSADGVMEAKITGLSSREMWLVPIVYGGRSTGTTTVNY